MQRRDKKEEKLKMGGYALGSAFDSRSGRMIMVALLLMAGSFYAGTLFGNNAPLYVSQLSSNSSSSSSTGNLSLSLSLFIAFMGLQLVFLGLYNESCCTFGKLDGVNSYAW